MLREKWGLVNCNPGVSFHFRNESELRLQRRTAGDWPRDVHISAFSFHNYFSFHFYLFFWNQKHWKFYFRHFDVPQLRTLGKGMVQGLCFVGNSSVWTVLSFERKVPIIDLQPGTRNAFPKLEWTSGITPRKSNRQETSVCLPGFQFLWFFSCLTFLRFHFSAIIFLHFYKRSSIRDTILYVKVVNK